MMTQRINVYIQLFSSVFGIKWVFSVPPH